MQNPNKFPNQLVLYRRRMGFSQEYAARMIGRSPAMLSYYESGQATPSLVTALSLAIVYRVPLEFLYLPLFRSMQQAIRKDEEFVRYSYQLKLF